MASQNRQDPTTTAQNDRAKDLKKELIRLVRGTNRGTKTTFEQRQEILVNIEALEALNETVNPALSDDVNGRWALLYTAAATEEAASEKQAGTVEGPFLGALKPLFGAAFRSRGNTQVIDTVRGKVENLAEFRALGALDGSLNILGSAAAVEPAGGWEAGDCARLDVTFDAFQLKLGPVTATIPLDWVRPRGWVDVTYLDETMRLGRGDKGSVFITARVGSPGLDEES